MTRLLGKAFKQASLLPAKEQDAFARWILDELESEDQWNKAFADSQEALARMATEIREEHSRGRTQPLDPDHL